MKHWRQMLAIKMYNHCNICNIPIYTCNIRMKHMQHTSKTSKTFKISACSMHSIPMRSPPSSASRRSRNRRRGQRVSTLGPDASPCASGVRRHRRAGRAREVGAARQTRRAGSRAAIGAAAGQAVEQEQAGRTAGATEGDGCGRSIRLVRSPRRTTSK
jgi:hypothetical protein